LELDSSKIVESTASTTERLVSAGKTLNGKQTDASKPSTPSKDKPEAWTLLNNCIEGFKV
jgi:hypothetical protein